MEEEKGIFIMSDPMHILLFQLRVANFKALESKEKQIEDFEYLLHHISIDEETGSEEIHHCFLFDHMANLFEQGHLEIRDGKTFVNGRRVKEGRFHILKGLESKQEISWSDEQAKSAGIKLKRLKAGMTLKEKAKRW